MKKIVLLLFLLITVSSQAQNTIYLILQPCDMGLGLRYDREWNGIGGYVSLAKGEYKLGENYIKNHNRVTAGFLYKNFSLGVVYNEYGEYVGTYPDRLFDPLSFELGGKAYLKHFAFALRFDFMKCEGSWDIGIKF